MTIDQAVADFLAADNGVSALVSTRVYQLIFPQSPTWPAVRVQLQDEPVLYTHDGPNGLRKAHLQIDSGAAETSGSDPYSNAMAVADAVDAAISGYVGPMGNESPGLDVRGVFRVSRMPTYDPDELRIVRIIQEYEVWYRA